MKKSILNLGKALNKIDQKQIKGGRLPDLGQECGFVLFPSTESQCLGLGSYYKPIWIASRGMCSALGNGDCND